MTKDEILKIIRHKLYIWENAKRNHLKFIHEKNLTNNYRALNYLDEICNEIILCEELILLLEDSI